MVEGQHELGNGGCAVIGLVSFVILYRLFFSFFSRALICLRKKFMDDLQIPPVNIKDINIRRLQFL